MLLLTLEPDTKSVQAMSSVRLRCEHVHACVRGFNRDLPHDDMPSAYSHQQTLKTKEHR